MNFISQKISELTTGGVIYIAFQVVYLTLGIFFMFTIWRLVKVLEKLEKKL